MEKLHINVYCNRVQEATTVEGKFFPQGIRGNPNNDKSNVITVATRKDWNSMTREGTPASDPISVEKKRTHVSRHTARAVVLTQSLLAAQKRGTPRTAIRFTASSNLCACNERPLT